MQIVIHILRDVTWIHTCSLILIRPFYFYFVNYCDFGPTLDELLCCPKGLHVWLVLPVATLVRQEWQRCFSSTVFFSFLFFPSYCNWEIASKRLSDLLPAVQGSHYFYSVRIVTSDGGLHQLTPVPPSRASAGGRGVLTDTLRGSEVAGPSALHAG